ncbi:methyltransferase domain-containing protein [Aquirufa ecclesiirivi]|uniref:methyltransferase domain-containing protein n=1 Tax=Aquirufa ecclesiirivi TaxID=2715124 RepID=UPI0022A846F4|nr:methyltransferase domain-containing protein [Aquirufa ecclesiirivi]MCZ2473330.1 methyltransferase domain-containing protein [Aquirufa ecclesiirivi]
MSTNVDLQKVKAKYNQGVNIMQALREELNSEVNTSEIIEIAYDMQSGSYVNAMSKATDLYFQECAEILNQFAQDAKNVMDAGAGELTTTAHLKSKMNFQGQVYAFDISWSRLKVGLAYFEQINHSPIHCFVADMKNIPLLDNSIDVVYTNHALEPNRGSEEMLLTELNRVANKKIILFEPYYEGASETIKARMDQHNYIRGLEETIKKVGCQLDEIIQLKNSTNPNNPTFAFIITPSNNSGNSNQSDEVFACPNTNQPLQKKDTCYFCETSFLAYPIIEGIPVLKKGISVLASHLND